MTNEEYGLWLEPEICGNTTLSGNAKLILSEILSLLKANGAFWASNGHLARRLGLTKNNVSYHIQEIKKLGWIKSKPVKHCGLKDCKKKGAGWHRHIYPLEPLSKILERLSNNLDSLPKDLDTLSSKSGEPIKSSRLINNTSNNSDNKSDNQSHTHSSESETPSYEEEDIGDALAEEPDGYGDNQSLSGGQTAGEASQPQNEANSFPQDEPLENAPLGAVEDVYNYYQQIFGEKVNPITLSPARIKKTKAMLKRFSCYDLKTIIDAAWDSSFYRGDEDCYPTPRDLGVLTFDYLISRPDEFENLLNSVDRE